MTDRTPEELQAEARRYITGCLANGITEIEQPQGLWAEIRRVLGPRHTVFSAAGWGWVNQTFAEAREAALDASLRRGLADSAAGRTVDLGDFTQYAGEQA